MEKFRGEQKSVTRFRDLFLFYRYDFVVGLLQGFMINAHESGSNSLMAGTFTTDLTKTKSLQCRDFTWALHLEKSISPLFPGPGGTWLQMTSALHINRKLDLACCARHKGCALFHIVVAWNFSLVPGVSLCTKSRRLA